MPPGQNIESLVEQAQRMAEDRVLFLLSMGQSPAEPCEEDTKRYHSQGLAPGLQWVSEKKSLGKSCRNVIVRRLEGCLPEANQERLALLRRPFLDSFPIADNQSGTGVPFGFILGMPLVWQSIHLTK